MWGVDNYLILIGKDLHFSKGNLQKTEAPTLPFQAGSVGKESLSILKYT